MKDTKSSGSGSSGEGSGLGQVVVGVRRLGLGLPNDLPNLTRVMSVGTQG